MSASPTDAAPSPHNRRTAALLAIILGDVGAHKFYLGQVKKAFLYLVFFWTFVPGILGIIEGIRWLRMSDDEFAQRFPDLVS